MNRICIFGVVLLAALLVVACDRDNGEGAQDTTAATEPASAPPGATAETNGPRTVDIVVNDYRIEAPARLPTGWVNFRLTNEGAQTHFVAVYRMPEGKTIEDQKREIVPPFEDVMQALTEGEIDKSEIGAWLGERLPEWAFTWVNKGGPGLLAPGLTSETTFLLDEPGIYLLECYVKAPDGTWHTSMGMLEQLEVTAAGVTNYEPETDVTLTLRTSGIEMDGTLVPGRNVVRVDFAEDPEGILPFDVHLARMDDGVDKETIVNWMDWANIDGMRAPSPVTFLGGAENAVAGTRSYLTVHVEAGEHAWVSEVDPDVMFLSFTVE